MFLILDDESFSLQMYRPAEVALMSALVGVTNCKLTDWLTAKTWVGDTLSELQETTHLLRNQNVRHRAQNRQLVSFIVKHMNPAHICVICFFTVCFLKIHFNITYCIYLRLPNVVFLSGFPTKILMHFSSLLFYIINIITLIIISEGYKLRSSSVLWSPLVPM
jgi:hypothetical protein